MELTQRVAGIVLAAGSGTRYGSPKQFEMVAGLRLVDRAVALVKSVCSAVVIALPPGREWDGDQSVAVVSGGATRNVSLGRALSAVGDSDFIVVHDAIRPFATSDLIERLLDTLAKDPTAAGAAPTVQPPDTVKRLGDDGSLKHVGRNELRILQTPTVYRTSALRAIESRLADSEVEETIELERLGYRVVGIDGDPWSHHIVTRRDAEFASKLLDP